MNAHEQVINKQVVHLMKTLGCSEAEAIQIIKDDEAIEKGEKLFEQTAEQKKATKQMSSAGGGKHKEKVKRERKVDEDKATLIKAIDEGLRKVGVPFIGGNLAPQNTAELNFEFNGNSYTVKLIKHRKPKEEK